MLYGEHTAHVEEVIDFAFSGRVLFAIGPAEDTEDAWITNDLRIAVLANAGDEAISRFRLAPEVNVSNWGNIELLGHNLASGDNLTIGEVGDEISWCWHDLMDNLVAELIWTAKWYQDREQQKYHDLVVCAVHPIDLRKRPPAIPGIDSATSPSLRGLEELCRASGE